MAAQYPPSAPTIMTNTDELSEEYRQSPYYIQGQDFNPNPPAPPGVAMPRPAPGISKNASQTRTTPSLTEEQVRTALEEYVDSSCCYGKDAASQMTIRDITKLAVFSYELDIFTEQRRGKWKTVPYSGRKPNSASTYGQSGIPPICWDFAAAPEVRFQKSKKVFELPNTSSICGCPRCQGSGRIQCNFCGGSGSTPCSSCSGMGFTRSASVSGHHDHVHGHHHGHHPPETTQCTWCFGSGRSNCSSCHRSGIRTCSKCKGHFRIKTYYELEIEWKCSTEKCVTVDGYLNSRYRKYFGRDKGVFTVAAQCSVWPQPLENVQDEGVKLASRTMLEGAVRKYQNSMDKVIEFRQTVLEIPATLVHFSWKGKEDVFLINGPDNRAYFPNSYPQNCCCAIL